MNLRSETNERDDGEPSNVVPLFPRPAAWEAVGDLFAAVLMKCGGRITLIERQSPEREEEYPGDCL